jgi:hypothetical protein
VPFAYYERLSRCGQAVYRASDTVTSLPVPGARALAQAVDRLRGALEREDVEGVAVASAELAGRISGAFGAPPPAVEVLAVRPRTEGFFKRESSLFHQLVPRAEGASAHGRGA